MALNVYEQEYPASDDSQAQKTNKQKNTGKCTCTYCLQKEYSLFMQETLTVLFSSSEIAD